MCFATICESDSEYRIVNKHNSLRYAKQDEELVRMGVVGRVVPTVGNTKLGEWRHKNGARPFVRSKKGPARPWVMV
jgi:hypothetical protein